MLPVVAACGVTSCDMMTDDLSGCPYGLYVSFRYDYNLQRADMFNDHVGSVTLYIFDESGKLVRTQEESNTAAAAPLADPGYSMHVTGLAPGRYRLIALAGQTAYADMMRTERAHFVRSDMTQGSGMQDLEIQLDRKQRAARLYDVVNNSLPLDTLWHGMTAQTVEVSGDYSGRPSYATVPLTRDTKKISVTMRELDDPTQMDIADYGLRIVDRNSHLLWDNSLDEADTVVYTPHATWNSDDRTPAVSGGGDGGDAGAPGRIGHADFMTSRIMIHDNPADDGLLLITDRRTGAAVAALNLPDILSRLRTSDDLHAYSPQEFLDRGYDYDISLFLKGGRLSYANISISVLGWTKRIQFEEL